MTTYTPKEQVLAKYRNRCILCGRKTETLHEIIPKSQLPRTWKREGNRVPLCFMCHNKVHRDGASLWRDRLESRRDKIAEAD